MRDVVAHFLHRAGVGLDDPRGTFQLYDSRILFLLKRGERWGGRIPLKFLASDVSTARPQCMLGTRQTEDPKRSLIGTFPVS